MSKPKFPIPSPLDYCAYCGELLADVGQDVDTAPIGSDGSLYCCEECRSGGEQELEELRYCSLVPPDYND